MNDVYIEEEKESCPIAPNIHWFIDEAKACPVCSKISDVTTVEEVYKIMKKPLPPKPETVDKKVVGISRAEYEQRLKADKAKGLKITRK